MAKGHSKKTEIIKKARKKNARVRATETKRICWCRETCGKLLTRRSRLRHYKILEKQHKTAFQYSESPELDPAASQLQDISEDVDMTDDSESAASWTGITLPFDFGSPTDGTSEMEVDQSSFEAQDLSVSSESVDNGMEALDLDEADLQSSQSENFNTDRDLPQPSKKLYIDSDPDSSSEAEGWKAFDEASEQEAEASDEEKQKTLEELLNAQDYEDWWKSSKYCIP